MCKIIPDRTYVPLSEIYCSPVYNKAFVPPTAISDNYGTIFVDFATENNRMLL